VNVNRPTANVAVVDETLIFALGGVNHDLEVFPAVGALDLAFIEHYLPIVPLRGGFDNRKWTLGSSVWGQMRKLFGLLFAVVAVLFLGMAYSQLARAESPDCNSVLATQMQDLIKNDKHRILDMQFELTAMKLALETLKSGQKTAEAYIKNQEALIKKLDDQGIRTKLSVLYAKNGEAVDVDRIKTAIQESVDKAKKGSYFKKAARFKNKDLSAYVEALYLTDAKSIFDENDAAILWLRSEISEGIEAKSYRGSAAANMQEISTRVAQLTGVAGTVGKTPDELTVSIQALQATIGIEFDKIGRKFTDEQKKSCAEMSTCATCGVDDPKNQIADEHKTKAMNQVIRAIGEGMIKDDKTREAAVQAVVDDLKNRGIAVERDPAAVKTANDAAKKLKSQKPDPDADPSGVQSSTPSEVSADGLPKVKPKGITVQKEGNVQVAPPKKDTPQDGDGQMGKTKKTTPPKLPGTDVTKNIPTKKEKVDAWVALTPAEAQCTDGAKTKGHAAKVRISTFSKDAPISIEKLAQPTANAVSIAMEKTYVQARYIGNGPIYHADGSANGYVVSGGEEKSKLNCIPHKREEGNIGVHNSVFVRYHLRKIPYTAGKYSYDWKYKMISQEALCAQFYPAAGAKAKTEADGEDLVEKGQVDFAMQSGPGVLQAGKNLLEGENYNEGEKNRSYIGVNKDGSLVIVEAEGLIGSYCMGQYLKGKGVVDLLHRDSNVSDAAFRDDDEAISGYPTKNPDAKAASLLVL
jgi:uncharacterized protein YigE (DUF2233 family)